MKTVPVTPELEVLEHTKITDLLHEDVYEAEYPKSRVGRMLRALVLVPIIKVNVKTPADWYIRMPMLWIPSADDEEQFSRDYAAVRDLILSRDFDALSSEEPPNGQGKFMTTKTAGRSGEARRQARIGGVLESVKPLGWFLRKDFVERAIRAEVSYPQTSGPVTEPESDSDEP